MPGEPIDIFSVEINADTDGFIKSVQAAMKETEKAVEKTANQIEGAFVKALAEEFKGDLFPEVEESLKRIGALMESLDIDLSDAVKMDLDQLEETGQGFGMNVDQMIAKVEELRSVLDVEIKEAVALAVKRLEGMGKKLSPEMVQKLHEATTQIRLTSSSTKQFHDRMKKLVETMGKQEKATKKSSGALKKLAGRMLVALGAVTLAQKAWSALTRFIKQSSDAFLKAADQQSDTVRAFKESEAAIQSTSETTGAFTVIFVNFFKKIELAAKQLITIIVAEMPKFIKALAPAVAAVGGFIKLLEAGMNNLTAILSGNFSEMENGLQAFADGYVETFEKMTGAADNLEAEFRANLEALGSDAERSARRVLMVLKKLEAELAKRLDRLNQRFLDRIEDLDIDLARDIEEAQRDLNSDLAEIDKEARDDAVEATIDYNKTIFRLEEDHKLALIQLENDYLFNIEDAVRERDARGVLAAQRQFNKAKKELEAQKGLRTKRLKEDFRQELAEIENERAIRRENRILEMQDELADLQRQYDQKRTDLDLDRKRALRDLEKFKNEELQEIAKAEGEKLQIQADGLTALSQMLDAAFGSDGWAIAFIDNYTAAWNSITAPTSDASLSTSISTATAEPGQLVSPYTGRTTGRQRGGTLFATSPTLLEVGEIPERVDITPLSQSTGQPRAGFQGGGGGGATDINLEVMLEDGLEAHLVDQTMDGVANVVLNIGRKAKR